jgi:hypothetical protein
MLGLLDSRNKVGSEIWRYDRKSDERLKAAGGCGRRQRGMELEDDGREGDEQLRASTRQAGGRCRVDLRESQSNDSHKIKKVAPIGCGKTTLADLGNGRRKTREKGRREDAPLIRSKVQ